MLLGGSRAMYHLGMAEIKAARMGWRGDLKSFHDGLTSGLPCPGASGA